MVIFFDELPILEEEFGVGIEGSTKELLIISDILRKEEIFWEGIEEGENTYISIKTSDLALVYEKLYEFRKTIKFIIYQKSNPRKNFKITREYIEESAGKDLTLVKSGIQNLIDKPSVLDYEEKMVNAMTFALLTDSMRKDFSDYAWKVIKELFYNYLKNSPFYRKAIKILY